MDGNYSQKIINRDKKLIVGNFDLLISLLSIVSAVVFIWFNKIDYLNSLVVLPIVFSICYIIFLAPIIHAKKSLTATIVAFCCGLRCVFLPVFISITGYSGFEGYQTTNVSLLNESALLMCWELIVICIFLFIVTSNKAGYTLTNNIENLGTGRYPLYLLILLATIIFFVSPEVRNYINFLTLNSNSAKVRGLTAGIQSSFTTGLITFVHEAFLCVFIVVLDVFSSKYNNTNKKIYVVVPTIVGLATVGLIFGESRATIIYTLFAVVSCLMLKFEKYKRKIFYVLIAGAVVILLGMTIYRLFAVYNFTTYSAAIANGGIREHYLSIFFESYLLGPQSVAAGIDFKNTFSGSFTIWRLLYDIFRPFMGFNIILQNLNIDTTITMYNSWISGVAGQSNGVFLQITNQGYCYFGFVFAPVFTCVFLALSVKIEKWMMRTKSLFTYFFLSYTFIRTSTCILGGTMNDFIVTTSMTLFMTTFFFIFQKLLLGIFIKRR